MEVSLLDLYVLQAGGGQKKGAGDVPALGYGGFERVLLLNGKFGAYGVSHGGSVGLEYNLYLRIILRLGHRRNVPVEAGHIWR